MEDQSISIEFQQLCLVINRGHKGAALAFPETGHILEMGMYGTEVSGLIELVVREGDRIVERSRTAPPNPLFIPDLGDVAGVALRPKDLDAIVSSNDCRAVISVSGGQLLTGKAYPPGPGYPDYADALWSFKSWSGTLTNWIKWTLRPAPGHSYWLEAAGAQILELTPGSSLIVTNRDTWKEPLAAPTGDFAIADDFKLLYAFVEDGPTAPVTPMTKRKPLPPIKFGPWNPRLPLCPVGQVTTA
jgi:hypothetical protein